MLSFFPQIRMIHPSVFWLGGAAVLLLGLAAAYWNVRLLEGLRKLYAPRGWLLFESISPFPRVRVWSIWWQWLSILGLLFLSAAGPQRKHCTGYGAEGCGEGYLPGADQQRDG